MNPIDRERVTPEPGGNGERGSALILALLLLISLTIMAGVYVNMSNTDRRITTNQQLADKALYLTETAWRTAYRAFAAQNFRAMTHGADGTWPPATALTSVSLEGLVLDNLQDNDLGEDEMNNGEWVWSWDPGDDGQSLSGAGLPERFRFRIYPASAAASNTEFRIDVTAGVGEATRRMQVRGFTEPAFTYTYFADGSLGEFVRGVNQTITGRVHANGDICLTPDGSTLSMDVTSMTSTGRMCRFRDFWGRPANPAGVVRVKDRTGTYQNMVAGAQGVAFDSWNSAWPNVNPSDAIQGAMERWGGVVRDGQLGAGSIEPPGFSAIEPGGYYEAQAGLKLYAGDRQLDPAGTDISATIGSAVRQVTFYNPSTQTDEVVQELDLRDLRARNKYPSNGVIYCDTPLRVVNADTLQAALSIISFGSVYTKGNFNSVAQKPAAVMTAGRIWHVSRNWNDSPSYTHNSVSVRQATNGTTTINAAMLDGVPTINESNYADLDGSGSPDGYPGTCWPNCDFLLESWGSARTLRKRGSIVKLEQAPMSPDPAHNTITQAGQLPWQTCVAYAPPVRDYAYDPALMGVNGQPPLAPLVAHITSCSEIVP